MTHPQNLKLGDIWLANLNPTKGTELGKTRPVLVLQSQTLLDVGHPSTLIVPLTTNLIDDAYPLRIRIKAKDKLKKDSDLILDQLRAIDNKRLVEGPLGSLDAYQLQQVYDAIADIMGMTS